MVALQPGREEPVCPRAGEGALDGVILLVATLAPNIDDGLADVGPSWRVRLSLAVLALAFTAGCSQESPDSSFPGSPHEAGVADVADDSREAGGVCSPSLAGASVSHLSPLWIAQLCASNGGGKPGSESVVELRCGSSILITEGAIDCGSFWYFDATTGALQAYGGGCVNVSQSCYSMPGFRAPTSCSKPACDICSCGVGLDAGDDGQVSEEGATDAPADASAD
jgi:hypothetical protein